MYMRLKKIECCLFCSESGFPSLCSPNCPGTHSIDQSDLQLRDHLPVSASRVLGIKGMHPLPRWQYFLKHNPDCLLVQYLWWYRPVIPFLEAEAEGSGVWGPPQLHETLSQPQKKMFSYFFRQNTPDVQVLAGVQVSSFLSSPYSLPPLSPLYPCTKVSWCRQGSSL